MWSTLARVTGLVVARLRAQPGQAVLVGALSGVLALTAVLGLAYARAVEESVQRSVLSDAAVDVRGASVSVEGERPPSAAELRDLLGPAAASPTWSEPVAGASANGLIGAGRQRVLVPVVAREGSCAHLTIASGRCTTGPGDVVLAQATASLTGLRVGSRVSVVDASAGSDVTTPVLRGLRVVGLYRQARDLDTYWFARPLTASSPGDGTITPSGAVFVGWSTLRSGPWRTLDVAVDLPLDVGRLTIAQVPTARRDVEALQRSASSTGGRLTSQLGPLLDDAAVQRRQARAPLPLLALQGVLLALVVLAYVAAATTEQRRPEVALARLRGQLPASAARMLVRDLTGVVVVGCLVGGSIGWGLARLAAARWLEPGVPVVLGWQLVAAVLACAAAAVVAVTLTAVPTVREPLVTLLRAVPPRSSTLRAGLADGAVVALCVAGLVTLLSGDPAAPTALVAPGLLALAGGLLLSQAVVPAAGALGRRQLARGRLATGLACVAVSRRPALRRLVAIETVAVALLVFAGAAGAVSSQQRETAARREVGAPVVLTVRSDNPVDLMRAVSAADPGGRYAVPVMLARPASGTGTTTVAADVDRLTRVAFWDDSGEPGQGAPKLGLLTKRPASPISFSGKRFAVDADFSWRPFTPRLGELGTASPPPEGLLAPAHLVVVVADHRGLLSRVDLGVLRVGRHRLAADLPCLDGCRLRLVRLERAPTDAGTALLDLVLRRATVDGRPLDLLASDRGWAATGYADAPRVDDVGGLHGSARSFGASLLLQRLDVPLTVRAFSSGGVAASPYGLGEAGDPRIESDRVVSGPALAGSDEGYERVGTLSRVPGAPTPALLVPLGPDAEVDGPLPSSTTAQVWLSDDDPARAAGLARRLAEQGVPVVGQTTVTQVATAAAQRGTGLSLHLATVIGVVALLLAASVLAVGVATSGQVRATDLAGLRAVGVPRRVVGAAAVREQLLVAVAGVVAGAVLGAAGAALTLSRSGDDPSLPAPQVLTGLPSVVLLIAVSLAVLGAVCLLLGTRLARSARPELLREGVR